MQRVTILGAMLLAVACVCARAQSSTSQWDGIFSEPQASRGEALYLDNCVMCHGKNLAGTVLAPAVAGPDFLAKWNRKPLSLVFNIIQTTMPFNLSGHLSPQQNADVLAYMLQQSESPAGSKELPMRVEALATMTILEKKPR
ncbi:MAG TPA: c-type cytochrome [Vicinamibacterales bacterium]|nr:c-type cytochrome [Vicinamibacterales bacterium]